MGTKAGTLEIDLLMNVARLQSDMAAMKKAVASGMDAIKMDAIAADTALNKVGTTAPMQMAKIASGSRLAGHQMTNLMFQVQDFGIQAAMAAGSAAPLKMLFMAFLQQGSQIQGIMAQAGIGVRGLVGEMLIMLRLMTVTTDAQLAAAAATARATAQTVAAELARAESAAVAAQAEIALASASYAVVAGTDAEAAALARLGKARAALATANAEAKIAQEALTAANLASSDASTAAAASTVRSISGLGIAAIAVAAVLGVAALAVKGLQDEANKGDPIKKYAESLGLSQKEMRKMKDLTVTFGDTVTAVFNVAARNISATVGPAVSAVWDVMKGWIAWIWSAIKSAVNFIIGSFVGAYNIITKTWDQLPAVLGDMVITTVNMVIKAINDMVKAAVDGINYLISGANSILGLGLQPLSAPQITEINNSYAGAAKKFRKTVEGEMAKARGRDWVGETGAAIRAEQLRVAQERVRRQAEQKGYLDPTKGRTGRDKESEFEKAVKEAQEYAKALEDETAKIGKTAIEIKRMEVAAKAAAAPTKELRERIIAAGKAWEDATIAQSNKEFEANVLKPLRDELALHGMTGAARARAALELEKDAFIAKNMEVGIAGATKRWEEYRAAKLKVIAKDADAEAEALRIKRLTEEFDALIAAINRVGDAMSRAFGRGGQAISGSLAALSTFMQEQHKLDVLVAKGDKTREEAAEISRQNAIVGFGSLASAAKGFFKEGTAGYKAMAAAEKAFALIQLANTAKNVAAGAAKMFATLGPWAFPVVAAMIGVMAALGFRGGKGGQGPDLSAEAMQKAQGTGTILGDSTAKSNSIAAALDIMAKNSNEQLEYSNAMVRSLRSIETGIGALTATIARQLGVSGTFDRSGLGLGSKTSLSALISPLGGVVKHIPVIGGIINGVLKALFGTTVTRTLIDEGIKFTSGTLGQIMTGGLQGAIYQLVEIKKKKKFLGISYGGSTKTQEYLSQLDNAVETQATLLLTSIYESVVSAAEIIGATGVAELLKNFNVNLGSVSLKDLKGQDLQDAVAAVFSKAADEMAAYALPGLAAFQKVGEGLFETLARLAKDYTTIDVQLQSIGRTFGAVGLSSVEAREALIDLFGSLDEFVDQTNFYREHFLTEAQQLAPVISAVNAEMSRLGLSGVTSIAQFKSVVDGIDLTTEAGREMYAALMAVASGFYAVEQYEKAQADKRRELETRLMELQGNAAGALAARRAAELGAMDESLRALQREIYLYEDIATAKDVLTAAYTREHDALEATIAKFSDFSASLKDFRDSLFAGNSGGLSYNAALAKLVATGSLAATGDETALGNLQGVSSDFLDIAKNNAGTLQQYRRAVALVNGYVSGAIDAADNRVTVAQQQLAALEQSVAGLIDINENVISVHDAIERLNALIAQTNPGYAYAASGTPPPSAVMAPIGPGLAPVDPEPQATAARLDGLSEEMRNNRTALEAVKVDTGKMARTMERWDGDGLPIRNNPAGDPITTEPA